MAREVLVVIETLGRDGGAERFLADIIPRLRQFGIACEVIALGPPYDLADEMEAGGTRVLRVGAWHRWFLPQSLLQILRLTRGKRYDVVWSHLYFGNLHGALLRVLWPATRLVTILHSTGYGLRPPRSVWQRFRMRLEQFCGRFLFDRIVAMSEATADDYRKHLGWKDIRLIPHAIPLEDMPPRPTPGERRELRAGMGLSDGDFCFISIARLDPQKGLPVLIAAFAKLAGESLRPSCLIVGAGGLERALLKQIEDAGLTRQVRLIAPMPHDKLMRLLQSCEAFVLPSLYEPQGIAAGEAMGLGLPCILSDVEGLRIWSGTEREALLVEPGDSGALAAALRRVHDDPALRRRLSAAGPARIRRSFGAAENAARWAETISRA